MAIDQETIRRITIQARTEGVDAAAASLKTLASAQDGVGKTTEQTTRANLSVERSYESLQRRVDTTHRAQTAFERDVRTLTQAQAQGLVPQERLNELLTLSAQRYNQTVAATGNAAKGTQQFTQQAGLARHELVNLGRQANDVVVSLAGGQGLGTVLLQQGSQIADVFVAGQGSVRGFASQAIGWLGRFAASAAGAATGAAAIGAGALYAASSWADAQREIDRSLIGLGRRAGVTANEINQIARGGATATGLSVDQARDAALEFVKTGAIYRDNIKAAVAVTQDFAIVTGKDAKDAAKDLGAALADPLQGADALNARLGFLDGRTREYIATLVSQNQKQEAQAVLLRNLAPAIQDATNTLGPFEKAWNAVANAAIGAKNAIGAALTPRTTEQRRDALVESLNRAGPSFSPGLGAQGNFLEPGFNARETVGQFDSQSVQVMKRQVEALNESLRETARARALAFSGDVKISSDADQAVRELLPYIDALKKVEEQISKIKAAQENPGAKDRQGLGANNEAAARAAQVLDLNLKSVAQQTDIANRYALQLVKTYGIGNIEVAKQVDAIAKQIPVLSAVTGQQAIQAQYQQTIATAASRNQTIAEATLLAETQRAAAIAQVNASVAQETRSLEDQLQLLQAKWNGESAAAAADIAYRRARDAGASSSRAAALSDATFALQREQDAQEGARMRAQYNKQAAAAAEREAEAFARAAAESDRIRRNNAFVALSTTWAGMPDLPFGTQGWNGPNGATQFNPQGYGSTDPRAARLLNMAAEQYGPGGFSGNFSGKFAEFMPNAQGYEFAANQMLATGGGIPGAIDQVLNDWRGITPEAAGILSRLTDLLPQGQQGGVIRSEIDRLYQQPQTIARDELIKQLTDKLSQLTSSTDALNDTMTGLLSPYYTQDPRTTHLGYRPGFADGGIMTRWGPMPLRHYADGGITSSPSLFTTSEYFQPEAIIPLKNGAVPVELRASNSNAAGGGKPTVVQIDASVHIYGNATNEQVDRVGASQFQLGQDMQRMFGRR